MIHIHIENFGPLSHKKFTEIVIAIVDSLAECRLAIRSNPVDISPGIYQHFSDTFFSFFVIKLVLACQNQGSKSINLRIIEWIS
jgi:hypothetical protein